MEDAARMVEAAIPGMTITMMGGACPFQAEGTLADGMQFYVRFRHNAAQMYVAPPDRNVFDDAVRYSSIFTVFDTDEDVGSLEPDEAVTLMIDLHRTLTPREGQVTQLDRIRYHLQTVIRHRHDT